jgi:predicted metal-dependent phosphoesterase TrpH
LTTTGNAIAAGNLAYDRIVQVIDVVVSDGAKVVIEQVVLVVNVGSATAQTGGNTAFAGFSPEVWADVVTLLSGGVVAVGKVTYTDVNQYLAVLAKDDMEVEAIQAGLVLSAGYASASSGSNLVAADGSGGAAAVNATTGAAYALGNLAEVVVTQDALALASGSAVARAAQSAMVVNHGVAVADSGGNAVAAGGGTVATSLNTGPAVAEGLGAIAVTDHNTFGGAQAAVEEARGTGLLVIPGEEVKTADQGEVIGLFLEREIPRGLSFADTIAAIKEQGGLVYLPHPFDRMHAIPDAQTIHRHLADIDVFEVYNARLLFELYNDEALRFARKYNLTVGAGSDAHVLQGVGTGGLRMRAFRDREEFLVSLRTAEVLRRPRSLAYLQALKWTAQVKERVLEGRT